MSTHNDRVLALLSDGKPHSHHELYDLHVIAHSRISDLRKKGYGIEQHRDGDLYLYQLVSEPSLSSQSDPLEAAGASSLSRSGCVEREAALARPGAELIAHSPAPITESEGSASLVLFDMPKDRRRSRCPVS